MKRKTTKRPPCPTESKTTLIEAKGAAVKIHTKANRTGWIHEVRYYFAGKEESKTKSDWEAALDLAYAGLARILNGDPDSIILSGKEFHDYKEALENISKTGMTLGQSTFLLAGLWERANGVPLPMIVEKHFELNPDTYPDLTLQKAFDLWIESLVSAGIVDETRISYRANLAPIIRSIGGKLQDLRTEHIATNFAGAFCASSTRQTRRGVFATFINWCVMEKLMSKTQIDFAELPNPENERTENIGYYSPETLTKILAALGPIEALVVALVAFGALRRAEIMRLSWKDFDWENGLIKVSALISKTGYKRQIVINPTLMAFLECWKGCRGPVCVWSRDAIKNRIRRAMESLGIEYITNGFRHCYGTFRVAELHRDLGRVAEEMGNAIQMIKKHYDGMERNAATVLRYWAIRPQPANWTMPTWFTVGRLTYAANTRAVAQAIDLASRARLLPKAKTHPIERKAALQKLRDAALKFMLNAPLPTFTVPIILVPPKPKKKVNLSVEPTAVEPMPMEPIPPPETMAA